jgi:OOP family OmpA-OmpF porin
MKRFVLPLAAALSAAGPAWAQSTDASVSLSDASVSSEGGYEVGDDPFEIGIFVGGMWLEGRETKAPLSRRVGPTELDSLGLEGGLRLGAYPIPYLGIEGEVAVVTAGSTDDTNARIGAARGHLVGQLPLGIVAPFVVVGGGVLGAECPAEGCGDQTEGREADGSFHFGVGAKLGIARRFHLRLDARDNIAGGDHVPEALITAAFNFGSSDEEPAPPPPPADSDGDGLSDDVDKCPQEAATTPDGCPIGDRDGDGKTDDVDACPDEPGPMDNGCPDPDPDKDGILAEADKCPAEAGIAPDGCPDLDPDKDGIAGDADKCPTEAETQNGFDDADGCPDEIPEKVKKFSGVMTGITFDLGKATIRRQSFGILDETVAVMNEYPNVKLRISGHTDSTGNPDKNRELSLARAEAVATYIASKGISRDRLISEGHGADKPIADNATKDGRQQNRRIEFQVVQ